MYTVTSDNYYDAARALHWYCTDYHSGMGSSEYRIQCELGYSPSCSESGCESGSESETFYQALEDGTLKPQELLEKIQNKRVEY